MRKSIFLLLSLVLHSGLLTARDLNNSVVKIMVTKQAYDFNQPWQKLKPEKTSGSGAVIEGNRILTCAHVVEFGTFIEIRKSRSSRKYTAYVEHLAPEYDLAILKLQDNSFFENAEPLEIGELPRIGDQVQAYGFPRGGNDLSITSGIISRIENIKYNYNNFNDLGIQIDAAINPGNSGGPVVKDSTLAGVAFQGLSSGQNIGYMIPTSVIKNFLNDLEDGVLDGPTPVLLKWQRLENKTLRSCFLMPDSLSGVLVNNIHDHSVFYNLLQPDDILLEVDKHPIENDGTIYLENNIKTNFSTYIQNKNRCDSIKLTLLRKKELYVLEMELDFSGKQHYLIEKTDLSPKYFIQNGFVFTTPSYYYFQNTSFWQYYYPRLSYYYYGRIQNRPEQREIVLIASVLPDGSNVGYHDISNKVVAEINNMPIRDFEDLVKAFDSPADYFVIKDIEGNRYVIDGRQLEANNSRINRQYGIPALPLTTFK